MTMASALAPSGRSHCDRPAGCGHNSAKTMVCASLCSALTPALPPQAPPVFLAAVSVDLPFPPAALVAGRSLAPDPHPPRQNSLG
ncbi:MAG TPA: hypothetical protein VND97_03215 [Beijerinckiaceae bacterium]|nr:hypothetical protein [Beijerinckiaceae bacterium]